MTNDPAPTYWACGEARPRQLDATPIVRSVVDFYARRGSSDGCGIVATIPNGPYLDFSCYTLGPDGDRWTYVNDFYYGRAGWARNTFLPNDGSKVFCGK